MIAECTWRRSCSWPPSSWSRPASTWRWSPATHSSTGVSRVAFRQGLLCNALNPKIAVFFTSLLPQFVGQHGGAPQFLVLGAVFNVVGITWLLFYAVIAARGRNVLTRPRVRRAIDRASGAALIGLGARIALEHRR